MEENKIGTKVLDAAFKVHSSLGPGLLESAYHACLAYEMKEQGLFVQSELPLPVIYKEIKLDCGYRLDILADEKVIIEVKSVETLNEVHVAQVLTYMKLSGIRLGYLINFNVKYLKSGIKRIIQSEQ